MLTRRSVLAAVVSATAASVIPAAPTVVGICWSSGGELCVFTEDPEVSFGCSLPRLCQEQLKRLHVLIGRPFDQDSIQSALTLARQR